MFQKVRGKKGQSTLEYIILVAAVIGIMIWLLANSGGPFKSSMEKTYNSVLVGMEGRATNLVSNWEGN